MDDLSSPPPAKFIPGNLVKGIPFAGDFIHQPMIGMIICESKRSNWRGNTYTRWYKILSENGKVVEEVEKYLDAI